MTKKRCICACFYNFYGTIVTMFQLSRVLFTRFFLSVKFKPEFNKTKQKKREKKGATQSIDSAAAAAASALFWLY